MPLNPVLILTRNNLALTQRCVESIREQDIPATIWVIDNGSTDGTPEWIRQQGFFYTLNEKNAGVSFGWNEGLGQLFRTDYLATEIYPDKSIRPADHVLVCNNDVVLPPWFYRHLLHRNLPFVTGIAVDKLEDIAVEPVLGEGTLSPHPDFSAFLIRCDCWEQVGSFDETMKHYSSDQDYHLRAHRKGIHLYKVALPFYHERSSTIRLAQPAEMLEIAKQADADRATLKAKWGVSAGGPDYEAMFREELFGVDRDKPVTP